jgi:phosphate:Na+ symporter
MGSSTMNGTVVLLNLAGAVALLLFATRMVRTGVERAYGEVLRYRLRSVLRRPMFSVAAGAGLAVALQSSTAVALIVGSFAGAGLVDGTTGLVAVLGADLGSALVVRLLSLDLNVLIPICFIVGVSFFLSTERRTLLQLGRILVGIGLVLLSLKLIGAASHPLRYSSLLPSAIDYLAGDPLTAFLLAAFVTWLFHSSVAAILLLAALASRGLIPADLGIVLLLGANLGAGAIALVLSRAADPKARIVPLGNMIIRGLCAITAVVLFLSFEPQLGALGANVATQLLHAHIAFNLSVVCIGVPLARPINLLSERIVALAAGTPQDDLESSNLSALDERALASPSQALANAMREVMRIYEIVEVMLRRIIDLYAAPDRERIDALSALDDRVDRTHAAIKLYLAGVTRNKLTEQEALRCQELLDACVKLEQAADIIVRSMLVHVQKKLDRSLDFTDAGWRELVAFHATVLTNARLAFTVLISRDPQTARQLVEEKDRLRDLEKVSTRSHFERLGERTEKSVETSSIHLDTIHDLKQINSLLTSIVYPVLEEHGLLRGSRLRGSAAVVARETRMPGAPLQG